MEIVFKKRKISAEIRIGELHPLELSLYLQWR